MADEAERYLKDVKSPTSLKRVLEFEVPRERVEQKIGEIIENIRKEVSLPGFRRGRAPVELVKARFADTARKEAIDRIIPDAYRKALETESLRPVLPAEIGKLQYGAEGPLVFQVSIELFPGIELQSYKGIKVEKEVKQVEDSDVDRELEALRERLARFENIDRAAEKGDIAILDYWQLGEDDKPLKDTRVTNYPVKIGAGRLVREFDDGLVGLKKGDSKSIDVTYPQDFPEKDLRGKTVRFAVEVKQVGITVLPEVDQDFAKKLGVDSVEAVRTKVRDGLLAAYEQQAESKMKQDIIRTIVEGHEFEVPEGLVNMTLDAMLERYDKEGGWSGDSDVDQKRSEIRERLRSVSINVVKEQFIIDEIAKREKLVVEEGDVEEILQAVAKQTGVAMDEVRKRAAKSGELGRWRRSILKGKVLDFLLENAQVQE